MKIISNMTIAGISLLTIVGCATQQPQRVMKPAAPQPNPQYNYQQARDDFKSGNYQQAFQEIQGSAQAGNADAQYALGYMYFYGKGTNVNLKLARYWFTQAANRGHVGAQRAIAMMNK